MAMPRALYAASLGSVRIPCVSLRRRIPGNRRWLRIRRVPFSFVVRVPAYLRCDMTCSKRGRLMTTRSTRRDIIKGSLAVAGLGAFGFPEWALPALAQGEVLVPFTDLPETFPAPTVDR